MMTSSKDLAAILICQFLAAHHPHLVKQCHAPLKKNKESKVIKGIKGPCHALKALKSTLAHHQVSGCMVLCATVLRAGLGRSTYNFSQSGAMSNLDRSLSPGPEICSLSTVLKR